MNEPDVDCTELDQDGYDASVAPDPKAWLASDEGLRLSAIERHHSVLRPHALAPNAQLHAVAHCMVENQLASDDPPETGQAMERLLKEGMVRHEIIHAIGRLITSGLLTALKEHHAFDNEGYSRDLRQLDRASWDAERRATRPKADRNKKKRDKKRRGR